MPKKSIITKVDGVAIAASAVAMEKVEVIHGEVMNAPLSDEERVEHEARITRILGGFQEIAQTSLEIWQDLKWIKEHRTYREKYDTFHDFCKDELGKDNSVIYRYIKDAEIKEKMLLEANTDAERTSIMSLKESNTRFIRTLPEEVQMAFWKLAYGIGVNVLPKKEDGSIETTTAFLESVGDKVGEITTDGGINLDGEFISITKIQKAAEIAGMDEDKAKQLLMSVGVSEEYFEAIKRQEQHIRERSMKADILSLKGTIEVRTDVNGSDYPIIIDTKGNETDLNEVILSFNNRFAHVSIKSPIRD